MRFIHSADWQLGARFAQFGPRAEFLRAVRLRTSEVVLSKADELQVDALFIAGDLFEDEQIDDAVVIAVLERFGRFPNVPIFVLPGNHDPATGPASVWNRKCFRSKPPNVTILEAPGVYDCAGAHVIASPLQQKVSTIDPSLRIAELARNITDERIRIGITHGALAIPARHKPNDFPIALDAASRAGVDYLAIGHWHNWSTYDGGKLVMPGTPEPDAFDQQGAGSVALIDITTRGATPQVSQIPVATLQWKVMDFDFTDPEVAKQSIDHAIAELRSSADQIVLRIRLIGVASPHCFAEVRQWLETALVPFVVGQIVDESTVVFSVAELDELKRNHPLLAEAVADLAQIEHLATNAALPTGVDPAQAIALPVAQEVLATAKIELAKLDASFFRVAQHLLIQALEGSRL